MSEILEANIFFFITGISVIIFTLILSIALYHLIKILKSLRRVMDRVEAGSEVIAADIEGIRSYFAERSLFARFLDGFLGKEQPVQRAPQKRTTQPVRTTERKVLKTELKIKDGE